MSTLVRWEPVNNVVTLRDAMDHLFSDSFVRPRSWAPDVPELAVPVDMYETKDDLVVSAQIPGIKPEDVQVTVTGDTLSIKGETTSDGKVDEAGYYRRERQYGAFDRTLSLPVPIQADKAEARFADGVLTLTLPKAEEIKPKTIKVKAQ